MRILFLVLFLLSSKCLTAQVLPFAGLPTRADTLDRSLNHTYIAYCLGKDTLKIRQLNDRLVFPLAQFRRLEKDSTWLPSEEKLAWFDSVQHQMAQNCFSYAFEWSFIELTNGPNPWFSASTQVLGPSTEWLLGYAYHCVSQNKARCWRRMQRRLPNKAYLLFRDSRGKPLHAAFFIDGIIYSKNGAQPPRAYLKLKELKKRYPDTRTLEVYRLTPSALAWEFHLNE